MKTPDVSKIVHAIFFDNFKPDFHNIGTGIVIKYKSVVALSARFDQMICIESAGWQTAEKDFWSMTFINLKQEFSTYCLGLGLSASIYGMDDRRKM